MKDEKYLSALMSSIFGQREKLLAFLVVRCARPESLQKRLVGTWQELGQKARERGSNEVLRKMFKERQKASAICENKPKKRDVRAAEVAERN